MPCLVTVGGFFGDEGKGKIIAYLAKKDNPVIAVRGGVGPNAGHTFAFEGKEYKVRMLPSAALNPATRLLIGAGVLVNPQVLLKEIEMFKADDRTYVDAQCGIIEQSHIDRDKSEDHLKGKIGTTGTGTGPANADRALRTLKLARDVPELSLFIEDVSNSVNYALENNENVLVEGTQGTYLSLLHGGYPFVTSKDVTASGICSDVGIGPKKVDDVLVVFKAYVTRVGGGPLANELSEDEAKKRGWMEFGSVTGRQRRAAPFDFELAKKSIRINSATQIAVTKLDVMFPSCAGVRQYEKMPADAKKFIEEIEGELGVKVTLIGTGPDLDDVVDRRRR
ncbi:adenylosuccinate synthase [Candidatus Nitrososphaera evergladensis SR1]|jgi:adenylosuccinate synthase|uniref:Adenylosuccinate synthetase n=1 Tax=Candidatus Nitrososphaera evergladensis SR1 TaxID=1459636 RepID=A0A075MMS9_9ARCH|nr:adenylosuccinate synthetase [Candidatus Nitrososphaera evergladensis]AIF82736.1 adenylosuccinate synthase [Candidatus Nitrososphaera evergladensis SR1]